MLIKQHFIDTLYIYIYTYIYIYIYVYNREIDVSYEKRIRTNLFRRNRKLRYLAEFILVEYNKSHQYGLNTLFLFKW